MRLGYFTMPVHPMHRNWAETLKEDREAIILADKLGFYDAFMGEHLTDKLREHHQQHDVQRHADLATPSGSSSPPAPPICRTCIRC